MDLELKDARILLVDDEPAVLKWMERLLRHEGFTEIRTTPDPGQCLDLYSSFKPDMVVLDLYMPKLSGFELLEQLKALEAPDSYVPVIVLSGDHDRQVRLHALKMGARDFLEKPLDYETVIRIRNHLEVRLLHRAVRRHRDQLESMVRDRTRELEDSRTETVRRLSLAAEYRDDCTGLHIARMAEYSAAVAEACRLPAQRVELLKQASPMHDVGKIGIPDAILLKPGKLTAEEFDTMKSHTVIGAEILKDGQSELIRLAEKVARSHHERWDGSGYPDGLEGPAIPLEARIVAICDVFDALTSERPYKAAWSVQDAVAELQRGRGSHFDPELLDCFMQVLPLVKRIRERSQELAQEQATVPDPLLTNGSK